MCLHAHTHEHAHSLTLRWGVGGLLIETDSDGWQYLTQELLHVSDGWVGLQLADRLVSGAGQDMLDALYWTATEPGRKRRRYIFVCLHFILALLYVRILYFICLGR